MIMEHGPLPDVSMDVVCLSCHERQLLSQVTQGCLLTGSHSWKMPVQAHVPCERMSINADQMLNVLPSMVMVCSVILMASTLHAPGNMPEDLYLLQSTWHQHACVSKLSTSKARI